MSLAQNITMLIEEHPHARPDGQITTRPAFLDQLAGSQMAQRQGGAGSNETRLPINTAAIALWSDLDKEARYAEQGRANTTSGTLGAIIERWRREQRTEWQVYLESVTGWMIAQIQGMFEPPPRRRALHQPCPACGQTWTLNKDSEREAALTAGVHQQDGELRPPSECDVTCADCGAAWNGDKELAWLLTAIDTQAA